MFLVSIMAVFIVTETRRYGIGWQRHPISSNMMQTMETIKWARMYGCQWGISGQLLCSMAAASDDLTLLQFSRSGGVDRPLPMGQATQYSLLLRTMVGIHILSNGHEEPMSVLSPSAGEDPERRIKSSQSIDNAY
jgi:hypothetical protein